jgi:emp24/gp25L/p24 family/GOLD
MFWIDSDRRTQKQLRTMKSLRRWHCIFFVACASIARRGTATPYTLLVNKAPKCWNVEVPSDTSLTLQYEAPGKFCWSVEFFTFGLYLFPISILILTLILSDMIIMEENPDSFKKDEPPTRREEDGLDARYNHQFHQRLDLLKRAVCVIVVHNILIIHFYVSITDLSYFLSCLQNIKDITLTITPRDLMGVVIVPRTLPKHIAVERLPARHREPFEKRTGSFVYKTGALEGGYLEVCIQSYTASPDSPSRISWTFVIPNEEKEIERQLQVDQQKYLEQLNVENKLISAETSRITAELVRMHRRAKALADDAQFSKQHEEAFRAASVQLHQAVHYWPMIRMLVLLVGGYLQVTHVVRYMKSRHIY